MRGFVASIFLQTMLNINNSDDERDIAAAKRLPPYERRVWENARAFYNISTNSHDAALLVRLGLLYMSRCARPMQLYQVLSRHAEDAFAMLSGARPMRPPTAPPPLPTPHATVIELPHIPQAWSIIWGGDEKVFASFRQRATKYVSSARFAPPGGYFLLDGAGVPYKLDLKITKNLVILPPAAHATTCCNDWYSLHCAYILKAAVEKYCAENGVKGTKVQIFL